MKTVFVTGGSGYIGRNLIRGLISSGYPVRALARSSASNAVVKSLGAVPVEGEVLEEQSLRDGISGPASLHRRRPAAVPLNQRYMHSVPG